MSESALLPPLRLLLLGYGHVEQAGSPIRLVSQANCRHGVLTAGVQPRKITTDDILHVGKGTTSILSLETEALGTITLVEHASTTLQTAYGVLSDLITILQQRRSIV